MNMLTKQTNGLLYDQRRMSDIKHCGPKAKDPKTHSGRSVSHFQKAQPYGYAPPLRGLVYKG